MYPSYETGKNYKYTTVVFNKYDLTKSVILYFMWGETRKNYKYTILVFNKQHLTKSVVYHLK